MEAPKQCVPLPHLLAAALYCLLAMGLMPVAAAAANRERLYMHMKRPSPLLHAEHSLCQTKTIRTFRKPLLMLSPIYKYFNQAAKLSQVEQKIEDLNRLQMFHGQFGRYYMVMPLSKRFDPPIGRLYFIECVHEQKRAGNAISQSLVPCASNSGQFSYGHVLFGDKVSFPASMLTQLIEWKSEIPWHFALEKVDLLQEFWSIRTTKSDLNIKNESDISGAHIYKEVPLKRVYCSVLDFRSPENIIFIPHWMMKAMHLRPNDVVKCQFVKLPECIKIKLRPHSEEFISLNNHQQVLEEQLRHYSSLTNGATIVISHNNRQFDMDVVDTSIGGNASVAAVSIQDCDVATDILLPPQSSMDGA